MIRKHRVATLLIVATVAVTGAAVVHSAANQAESGVIYSCKHRSTGQLRAVADSGNCRRSERPLSWNVVGPAGPQGPPGPQGDPDGFGTAILNVNGYFDDLIRFIDASGSVPAGAGTDGSRQPQVNPG
jgi:hypothetical protein